MCRLVLLAVVVVWGLGGGAPEVEWGGVRRKVVG